MAELKEQVGGPAAGGAAGTLAAPGSSPSASPDPLAALHKMSTTAGISSQDYAAINTTSIVALLLGMASVLSLFATLLLVIPLAAVVCGVVAWGQVRRSNGTQTGAGYAMTGIVLAVLLAGFVLVRTLTARAATRSDEQAVVALIGQLSDAIGAGNYDAAYALFSPSFKNRVDAETFSATWKSRQTTTEIPPIQSLAWNRRIVFETDPESGKAVAVAGALATLKGYSEPARESVVFVKDGGRWSIDNFPSLFPKDRPRRGGPPPAGPNRGG